MLEILSPPYQLLRNLSVAKNTHDSTFEKSAVGDMTKLSLFGDQDIKFAMLGSSSILFSVSS